MGGSGMITLHTPTPGIANRCLAIDDLVAMVDGTLETARSEAVLAHVDRCSACAEVIANLGSLDGPARRVGRYQIELLLGTGGMGIVYAAFDPELQRRVAIKLVRPDNTNDKLQAMILKEARTLARVSHPNVVAVYDVGVHDGEVYVATEYVDGVTLAAWQPHRDAAAVVGAWVEVARGLAAAHAQGVVHRDVKPSNVLVGRDGRVRIGDFGIAHRSVETGDAQESAAHLTHAVAGTPAYMAPEQKAGRVDARSDQFSTCVALVEALTGRRPEANEAVNVEPPALAFALARGLRANPDDRFPTMTDLANALQRAIAPPPPRSRGRVYVAIASVAAATAAVAIFAVARSSGGDACSPAQIPAAVWSPARRAALAKVLPADLGPAIDRYLSTWTNAAADVCVSTHAMHIRAQRTRCLEQALSKLDQVVRSWEEAAPRRVLDLYDALDLLPHAAWCSHAAVVAAGEPPPEHAAAISAIEAELDAAEADKAQLLVRARATGYTPLIRRVAMRRAEQQSRADALQTLRNAIAGEPHDFTKVKATILLLAMLDADGVAEAEQRAREARELIAALGGDLALEGELDWRLSAIYASANRTDDTIAAAERFRQNMRAAYGAGSAQEGLALISLAGAYYKREGTKPGHGRELAKAADEIMQRLSIAVPSVLIPTSPADLVHVTEGQRLLAAETYGAGSVQIFDSEFALMYAYAFNGELDKSLAHALEAKRLAEHYKLRDNRSIAVDKQIGELLLELGRHREAIPYITASIDQAKALALAEDVALGSEALGRALVQTGDLAAARAPLELALATLTRTTTMPGIRGRARFFLAMVEHGKAPAKALANAHVARVEIEGFLETADADVAADPVGAPFLRKKYERTLAELDAWVAKHAK